MASTDARRPRDPPTAASSRDGGGDTHSFAAFLNLRSEARRRNCQPAVVMHQELLTATRCRHCKQQEDLAGPGRSAMNVPQDISTSWGDCLVPSSSSGRAGSSARLPSLLPGPAYEATLPVLQGATGHPNPTLEVQATRGVCLGCAKEIYHKTRHLRHAVNVNGDTALHCAARAGNLRMICHLVTLAAEEASYGGGNGREAAEAVLRRHNRRGDTALHEAIRSGGTKLARLLLWVDAQLPRVPGEGTSPLYLAVSLGREDFVRLLLRRESQANLSYSGPDGQNALHAAVLRGSADTTCMLLCLNKDLIKQRDRYGSTPLHFAASVEAGLYAPSILSFSYIWDSQLDMDLALDKFRFSALRGPITALLNEDSSSAYLPDNDGLLPVHVAASAGKIKVLHILLGKCPDSAGMRDAKGRTFLHVAVEKKRHNIVAFACQEPEVAWVLNMQDNDGNTAIHLAVRVGDLRNFCSLMKNRKVRLNVRNNNEQTPLDVSCCGKTRGLSYGMDPRISIHRLLIYAHAQNGNFRWDQFENEHIPTLDEENEGRKITESTQALGIGAVLVATATFAAAFTMPGGYRADDHTNGGAPTRAGRYSFDAFVIANALAFTLSCLATTLLVLSGAAAVNIGTRLASLSFSVAFLLSAARSFCVAFALGLYVVLSPVALPTAVAACVITSFTLLDATLFVRVMFTEVKTLHCRQGISAWWLLGRMIILNMLSEFWSYIVIFSLPAILKIHRN